MILVTCATGSNGTEIRKLLAARGVRARAMVRVGGQAKGADLPPGIEIVTGDFDDPPSLERALQGVDRAFLLTNSTSVPKCSNSVSSRRPEAMSGTEALDTSTAMGRLMMAVMAQWAGRA